MSPRAHGGRGRWSEAGAPLQGSLLGFLRPTAPWFASDPSSVQPQHGSRPGGQGREELCRLLLDRSHGDECTEDAVGDVAAGSGM